MEIPTMTNIKTYPKTVMIFQRSHTLQMSRTWLWISWDAILERGQIASLTRLMHLLRPCCAETHWIHASHESHNAILYWDRQGGNPTWLHTYIALSNFCHFLRNRDSKYCFLSCNRCSLRFNNGHLFTLRAYLIFLHRASKALSRAANSFMLVSWSRLLRNIHS